LQYVALELQFALCPPLFVPFPRDQLISNPLATSRLPCRDARLIRIVFGKQSLDLERQNAEPTRSYRIFGPFYEIVMSHDAPLNMIWQHIKVVKRGDKARRRKASMTAATACPGVNPMIETIRRSNLSNRQCSFD
jgi:hypothetical protein